MERILLVEDGPENREIVERVLGREFELTAAATLADARHCLETRSFDLILLDVTLPDGDGFKFCASARDEGLLNDAQVVFVTGKTQIEDRVFGFSVGGDDYIPKPYHPLELRARVRNLLNRRKRAAAESSKLEVEALRLDLSTMNASAVTPSGDTPLELTPMEFKILVHLARNFGRVISRGQLLDAVWGDEVEIYDRTVDAHLSKLRRKLLPAKLMILSRYSVGYQLASIPAEESRA